MMFGSRAAHGAIAVCLGALLLGSGARGAAQQAPADVMAPPSGPPIEIVVTGSRTEERIDRAANATEVIRRAEIEKSGARDAAELLEERSGMQVVRSFRGSELQLRGLDPEYTLILIDSMRVPGQIDGAIDLTRYGVENIERVEIVRGPGSALYGSDAMGGIVNILTRESKRDFEADAFGSYGQRNVIDVSGTVAGRPFEPLRLQLSADWHRADAYSKPGEIDTRVSGRNQWSSGMRITLEPDERHTFIVRGSYLHAEYTGVDAAAGGAVYDRTQLQEQPQIGLEHRLQASPLVRLVSRVNYSQFRDQYLQDQRGGTQLDRYEDNREHLGQLNSIASFAWSEAHRSTLGVEELLQQLDSERLSRSGQRFRFAAFGQHAWLVYSQGGSELEIVPGVRLDADSQFGTQVSPKLALRFRPFTGLELRASYGRGFRAPTFQELLLRFENPSVGYIVIGNPDLGAETSHGVDAGARLFNELGELSLTFFRNDLTNMITYVLTGSDAAGMVFTYDNATYAWTTGIEAAATLRVRDELSFVLGYTWLNTWDDENKRKLQGRPTSRVTGNIRLAHPGWGIELVARGALAVGRRFYVPDDVASESGLGSTASEHAVVPKPLAQVDLRLAKHFGRPFELFVAVDNLFDAGDAYTALRPLTVYGGARGRY